MMRLLNSLMIKFKDVMKQRQVVSVFCYFLLSLIIIPNITFQNQNNNNTNHHHFFFIPILQTSLNLHFLPHSAINKKQSRRKKEKEEDEKKIHQYKYMSKKLIKPLIYNNRQVSYVAVVVRVCVCANAN